MSGLKIFVVDFSDYEEAQKAVRANPKEMGAPPTKHGSESGQRPIFFDIILDISGSMSALYDELVSCFNEIMIPSLQGAADKRYKAPMRIGCLLFSEKMVPAWWGYKSLKELGKNPLKREMLNQDGLRGQTALYGAMRAGILWTSAAMKHMEEDGESGIPQGKIIVLSDGANNIEPSDPSAVTNALTSIGKNRERIQRVIGFFNTSDGLTKPQFDALTKATNFEGRGFYEIAKGSGMEEKKRNFRHNFKIFSDLSTR